MFAGLFFQLFSVLAEYMAEGAGIVQVTCSNCSRGLSVNAIKCPHCGKYHTKALVKYGCAIIYVIIVTIVYYKWVAIK